MGDRFDWIRGQVFGRIVDIGCNSGQTFAGTPFAPNCFGVDMDDWRPPYGLGFVRADAHALPFKDKEFDCAVMSEILEHVKDPIKVLKEARRVVRGCVFFTIPFEQAWDPKHRPMMKLEDRMKLDNLTYEKLFKDETTGRQGCLAATDDKENPHLWHIRYYTPDTLCADLEKAELNYKIEMLSYDGWVFMVGVLH